VDATEFVPFGNQLTTNPFADRLDLEPLPDVALPTWVPPVLDGLDAIGATASGGSITVAYAGQQEAGRSRAALL
jgi:hypothetical protein